MKARPPLMIASAIAYMCVAFAIMCHYYLYFGSYFIFGVEIAIGPVLLIAGYIDARWAAFSLYIGGVALAVIASSTLIPGESITGSGTASAWYAPLTFVAWGTALLALLHLIPAVLFYLIGYAVNRMYRAKVGNGPGPHSV